MAFGPLSVDQTKLGQIEIVGLVERRTRASNDLRALASGEGGPVASSLKTAAPAWMTLLHPTPPLTITDEGIRRTALC